MAPSLLVYNLSAERLSRIRLIAGRYGIRLRTVRKTEYGLPLEALLGLAEPPESPAEAVDFEDEMLVMAGFPGHLTHSFLNAFRQYRLPPVRLKAMLTDTNRAWTSAQLHEELNQEAAYFAKMKKGLHQSPSQEEEKPDQA